MFDQKHSETTGEQTLIVPDTASTKKVVREKNQMYISLELPITVHIEPFQQTSGTKTGKQWKTLKTPLLPVTTLSSGNRSITTQESDIGAIGEAAPSVPLEGKRRMYPYSNSHKSIGYVEI